MKLSAKIKTEVGKSINRRLRQDGLVPAVLYGEKQDPIPLVLNQKEVGKVLTAGGRRRLHDLDIEGLTQPDDLVQVLFKDIQRNVLNDSLLHIDFYSVRKGHRLTVQVPVKVVGDSPGIVVDGGVLQFLSREITVECLPKDIPDQIEVDITELGLGESITISTLSLPEEITVSDDPAKVIVSVVTVATPVLDEEEAEGAEDEGDESAEDSAAPETTEA